MKLKGWRDLALGGLILEAGNAVEYATGDWRAFRPVLGEAESAIDLLEQSAAHGFQHREWFENDPDLESLRAHPRFKALLQKK